MGRKRTARIGLADYRIRWHPGPFESDGLEGLLCGAIDHGQRRVEIDGSLSGERLAEVLWHEAVHALVAQGLLPPGEDEERICDALSAAIVQVLRDNGPEWRP